MTDDDREMVPIVPQDEAALRELAVQRIKARREFHAHLTAYILVNLLLWVIWLVIGLTADSWFPWPVFPTFGWGIGLGMHAWAVYGRKALTEDDIQREMQKLRGK